MALSSYLSPVALCLLWHLRSLWYTTGDAVPQETQCHKRDIFKIFDYQILKMIIFLRESADPAPRGRLAVSNVLL